MDADEVADELQALQRGRGLRRPNIRAWLGPHLTELVGCEASADDEVWRTEVSAMLVGAADSLPRDQRYLFLVTSGIASDALLLKDRMTLAGEKLQRDHRSLSRRLRAAEQALAEFLLANRRAHSVYDPQGWPTTAGAQIVDLASERPSITQRLTVRATRDRDTYDNVLSFLRAPDDWGGPEVEVLSGGRLTALVHETGPTWRAIVRLPATVRAGEEATVELRVTFESRALLAPFVGLAPVVPVSSFDLEVDFGTPSAARKAWLFDDVPPFLIGQKLPPLEAFDPAGGMVRLHFADLKRGMAYGIGWEWAD